FPTGDWHKGGQYGADVTIPLPFEEANNPNIRDEANLCLDRNACSGAEPQISGKNHQRPPGAARRPPFFRGRYMSCPPDETRAHRRTSRTWPVYEYRSAPRPAGPHSRT